MEKQLYKAPKALFDETADYIKKNHLGDPLHNQTMKQAKATLEAYEIKKSLKDYFGL